MDAGAALDHARRGRRRHRARPRRAARETVWVPAHAALRDVGAAARAAPDLPQAPDLMPPQSERAVDATPVHTADLPRRRSATGGSPRPRGSKRRGAVLDLGADLDEPEVNYLRRIGPWLLWRAGPPSRGDARDLALWADDLGSTWTFRVLPDGSGEGEGPDGVVHQRFRTWKEALRDAGPHAPSRPPERPVRWSPCSGPACAPTRATTTATADDMERYAREMPGFVDFKTFRGRRRRARVARRVRVT